MEKDTSFFKTYWEDISQLSTVITQTPKYYLDSLYRKIFHQQKELSFVKAHLSERH